MIFCEEELKGVGIHFTKGKKHLSDNIFISLHHFVLWDQTLCMLSTRKAGQQGRWILSCKLQCLSDKIFHPGEVQHNVAEQASSRYL